MTTIQAGRGRHHQKRRRVPEIVWRAAWCQFAMFTVGLSFRAFDHRWPHGLGEWTFLLVLYAEAGIVSLRASQLLGEWLS